MSADSSDDGVDSQSNAAQSTGPLTELRAVEVGSGIAPAYAGRLLADLGADVIKVETAEGDPLRNRRSLADPDNPENRVDLFAALNIGKRGRTVRTEDLHAELADLASTADVVISDVETAGVLQLEALQGQFPHLVVSISSEIPPDVAPASSWAHLHASALSGTSFMIGRHDRSPLPPPYEIGEYEAGANLAGASLTAVLYSKRTGQGQIIQVHTAEVLFSFIWSSSTMSKFTTNTFARDGRRFPGSGGPYPLAFFPCADGYVAVIGRSQKDWDTLLDLMGNPDWSKEEKFRDPLEIARHHADEADVHLRPWFAQRSGKELLALSKSSSFPMAPLNTIANVLGDDNFIERQVFAKITPAESAPVIARNPFTFGRNPTPKVPLGSPTLGGLASFAVHTTLSNAPATTPRVDLEPTNSGPLSGLRVLDLGWIWSGPMVSSALADLGAEVIKVEHRGRLDNARLRGRPLIDGRPMEGPLQELSLNFHQNNRGKKSVTLNIKHPDGLALMQQLMCASDVVVENLTPGVYDRAGCGFAEVSKRNKRLIWLSLSSAGRTGSLVGLRAYAPTMSSLAGLESLVGYQDDPSVGMIACSLADPNAGSHAIFAVLAALFERSYSGLGQQIDMSQIETMMSVLCEPFIDAQTAGHQPAPWADLHPDYSPHGHFRCLGDDKWVAVAVHDDAMWSRLVELIGQIDPNDEKRLTTAEGRRKHRMLAHSVVAQWTCRRDRSEVVQNMRNHEIAVAPIWSVNEAEEHFRESFDRVSHPVTGIEHLLRVPWRLGLTPPIVRTSAPTVGEHTESILGGLLGKSDAEIAALVADGAAW